MTKKDTYSTHAATLSPAGLTFYCYNENLISISEFVVFENVAFTKAMQRQWKLFANYEFLYNEKDEVFLGLCFN